MAVNKNYDGGGGIGDFTAISAISAQIPAIFAAITAATEYSAAITTDSTAATEYPATQTHFYTREL